MVSCVFPGSFDPVTKGHLDLILRAASLFDHVTVTVMVNIRKKGAIPAGKRVELIKKACSGIPNITVDRWDGLLAEYMKEKGEKIVIRGLRSGNELDQELCSLHANRMLNGDIETVFLASDPSLSGVSSSAVREIAAFGGSIETFVPEEITEEISSLLSNKKK